MNIFQSIFHDTQKQVLPPHVGETFFLWTYYLAVGQARALLLVMANHTNDSELKETIEHFVGDVMQPQLQELEKVMKAEGIVFPNITPDAPKADEALIPPGAKLVDDLLAKMLMVKVEGLLEIAYQGLRFSFRTDLSGLFMRYLSQVSAQGYTLRELMLKRGWLPYPPSHYAGTNQAQ